MVRCPGQDRRFWRTTDIFEMECPYCGQKMEFWKDDPRRECKACGKVVSNPRINLSCAQWCQYAEECLGIALNTGGVASPLEDKLKGLLHQPLRAQPERLQQAADVASLADTLLASEGGNPVVIKPAALLLGALLRIRENSSGNGEWLMPATQEAAFDWHAVLNQTGFEPTVMSSIEKVVESILANNPLTTRECDIVWDALHVTRLVFLQPIEGSLEERTFLTTRLKTTSARQMAIHKGL